MKKDKIFSNYSNLKKWQQTFNLTFNWQKYMSPIICSTLALSTLAEEIDTGYYLAKQQININYLPPLNKELVLTGEIIKSKEMSEVIYVKCKTIVQKKGGILISLISTLIKPKNNQLKRGTEFSGTSQYWRNFNSKQIFKFSQYSSDPNNIHLTKEPIVQGMLIFLALEDYLAKQNKLFKKATISYCKPIRSNNAINLAWQNQNKILGIVDKKICFNLNIKEEL